MVRARFPTDSGIKRRSPRRRPAWSPPASEADPAEAFCAGLLHTIGSAVLHQQANLPVLCLPFPADSDAVQQGEVELYGIDHAAAGAQLLSLWNFPTSICDVVAGHHDKVGPQDLPLKRVIGIGRILADVHLSPTTPVTQRPTVIDDIIRLADGGLTATDVEVLLADVGERADALRISLK